MSPWTGHPFLMMTVPPSVYSISRSRSFHIPTEFFRIESAAAARCSGIWNAFVTPCRSIIVRSALSLTDSAENGEDVTAPYLSLNVAARLAFISPPRSE